MLPIASGKGGVGKSLIAANLAVALARAGKQVVLADLDLGGSNLHTILGMRGLPSGIGTFLSGRSKDFMSVVYPTDYEGLRFIPGDAEIPGMANLTAGQKKRLLNNLNELDADYLVVDLGSGSTYNTIDFFLASPGGIVITTPDLTAILNAYLFLKNTVFRMLMRSFPRTSPAAARFRELRRNPETMQRLYVPVLIEELRKLDPEGVMKFVDQISRFKPSMILNLLDDPRDAAKAGKIRRSCKQYLGLDVEHLGITYRDTLQDTALASGLPIVVYKPDTVLSRAIHRIADKVIESEWSALEQRDFDILDEAYQTAETEAELDYDYKLKSMHDLIAGGVITQGDLVETIRTQQYEIGRLRAENAFLKTKIIEAAKTGYSV